MKTLVTMLISLLMVSGASYSTAFGLEKDTKTEVAKKVAKTSGKKAGGGFGSTMVAPTVRSFTGKIVSIDCNDRVAEILNEETCQRSRVTFNSRDECRRNEYGDVITVKGEVSGSDIRGDEVTNAGKPKLMSGFISSIDCKDETMEVETCGEKCRVAVEGADCRGFHYGDRVTVGGDFDSDSGCIEYAESVQVRRPPARPTVRR